LPPPATRAQRFIANGLDRAVAAIALRPAERREILAQLEAARDRLLELRAVL
jgi:hypothetical protein